MNEDIKKRIMEKVETVIERVEFIEDDYSDIDFLVEHDILEEKKAEKLKEANGLRNRLIHGYDSLDDETACYAIIELIEDLRDFSVAVLEWKRENSS